MPPAALEEPAAFSAVSHVDPAGAAAFSVVSGVSSSGPSDVGDDLRQRERKIMAKMFCKTFKTSKIQKREQVPVQLELSSQ